ncbi:hypothetical protein [Dyadobacter sp. NIV53]|uniref:hypothetical protein n=1 Tax=Dyadobacter sp. NIV53 TaxID=2861765 RepID=UPI001E60FD60|nr:hypothetical protein [Dyadobacter sp. NIV53]
MLFNAKDERIGFLTKPINAGSDSLNYQISMALSDNTPLKVQRTIPKVNNYTVVFNKAIEKINVTFTNKDSLPYLPENGTQIKFFNVQPHPDSTFIKILAIDSLGKSETFNQKIAFLPQRGKERQRDQLTMSSKPEQNKPLSSNFTYTLLFNKPIQTINDQNISLVTDSLTHETLNNLKWKWNVYHSELTITAQSFAKDSIKWEIPKGSIISVEGDTLPRILLKHPLLNEENYGIVHGNVINADTSTHFIVELLDEQYKVFHSVYSSPYTFRQIPQGKYFLRLILDINNNRRWDTGQIDEDIQPEPIIYLPEKILIKSNFELNDVNISIPKAK